MRSRSFCDCRQDRKKELADPVAGDVLTEIDHVQADAVVFQPFEGGDCIGCVAERTIQLEMMISRPSHPLQ